MVRLNINRKRSGVPVISRNDIDIIGEKLIRDFSPEALVTPQAIDIDLFAQEYLGYDQDFQYLSHCGVYLGMTVFNDTDKVVVYNPESNQAEYISAKANTIIIDNSLLNDKQEHRYRFTMGHESGHGILHEVYFGYDPNQCSLFGGPEPAMIQCRTDTTKLGRSKDTGHWDDRDWMEWQANAMASALLMPKSMVEKLASQFMDGNGHLSSGVLPPLLISHTADTFNVSFEAAGYRLKSLGLIDKKTCVNSTVLDFLDIVC